MSLSSDTHNSTQLEENDIYNDPPPGAYQNRREAYETDIPSSKGYLLYRLRLSRTQSKREQFRLPLRDVEFYPYRESNPDDAKRANEVEVKNAASYSHTLSLDLVLCLAEL
jgi:hypothetical protein